MSSVESHRGQWCSADIPFDILDASAVRSDTRLLQLLASASFVEITSDLYAGNLVRYFTDDPPFQDWLATRWEADELRHGRVLKAYVNRVWPEFPWEAGYRAFLADYVDYCRVEHLGPTPVLELARRCVVETGTATLYTAIARSTREPVLRSIAEHIRGDEVHHYNRFHRAFRERVEQQGRNHFALFKVLLERVGEIDDEDACIAFRHVSACHTAQSADATANYRSFRRHFAHRFRNHYPYRAAAKMLLRPLGLGGALQRVSVSCLATGARLLMQL